MHETRRIALRNAILLAQTARDDIDAADADEIAALQLTIDTLKAWERELWPVTAISALATTTEAHEGERVSPDDPRLWAIVDKVYANLGYLAPEDVEMWKTKIVEGLYAAIALTREGER